MQNGLTSRLSVASFAVYRWWGDRDGVYRECGNGVDVCHYGADLAVVVFGIIYWTIPMYRRVQGQLDRISVSMHENLPGSRMVLGN